ISRRFSTPAADPVNPLTASRAYPCVMTEWGIDTLFNPSKRHMDEEKRRLQSTRQEVGDSSGGRRIDLDSGVVVISRKKQAQPSAGDNSDDISKDAEDS